MRVFVTGGSGFIGKSLTRLLAERGHDLLVLTRSPQIKHGGPDAPTFLEGNLENPAAWESVFKEFRPQALIHLAWEGIPDYGWDMSRRNLEYSISLFSLAIEAGCSCILSTGSCWEYASKTGKVSEDSDLGGAAIFPSVKNALRFIGEAICRDKGVLFYWLRLFYVYGPGQRRTSLMPHIIESVERGEIPQIQTPQNKNDFIFVDDVSHAIVSVIEQQPENTVYNVGSGYSTAVEDIVRITCDIMNKTSDKNIFTKKQSGDVQNFWADISRIKKDVGWQPEYDIKSGIKATIKK